MQYHIVTFHAIVDGKDAGTAVAGHKSAKNEYHPSLFKGVVIRQLRKDHPGAKVITVKFVDTKEVAKNEFHNMEKSFVVINEE